MGGIAQGWGGLKMRLNLNSKCFEFVVIKFSVERTL